MLNVILNFLGEVFESALINALVGLADCIELDLRVFGKPSSDTMDSLINVFLIVFEIPALGNSEYLELALHMLCKAVSLFPIKAQAKLARIWAKHCNTRLPSLLQSLQQLITVKVFFLDIEIHNRSNHSHSTLFFPYNFIKSRRVEILIVSTGDWRIFCTGLLCSGCRYHHSSDKGYENTLLCKYVNRRIR